MTNLLSKKWLLGAVVAVLSWANAAADVNAGWWHRHSGSSGGSSGSWGSSGSSGGSSGSSGSWGSSGSSGGYSTSNDVIIEDGAVIEEGAMPATEGAAPAAEGVTTEPQAMHSADSAVLTVQVPTNAKIYVNGVATTSEGAERNYVSRDLRPGFNYTYELRAEFVREGKSVTETKSVTLTAGQTARVDFEAETTKTAAAGEPLTTVLKVNVPANAKVFLAGHETDSFGSVREFSTSRLNSGDQWENYTIRVEADVDGRMETQEETITLAAGDNREVNFDFAATKVASK